MLLCEEGGEFGVSVRVERSDSAPSERDGEPYSSNRALMSAPRRWFCGRAPVRT